MLLDFIEFGNAVIPADVLHDMLVVDALHPSTPSTNRILRFAISTHLDSVAGRNSKLVFCEHRREDLSVAAG